MLRRILLWAAVLLPVAALGGFLFAWSGLFNIAASSGHWPVVAWFLHFTMRNSVETHSTGIDAPRLDDPALVKLGAGHYAFGCAACHGTVDAPPNPIVREMTPNPPHLIERIPRWDAAELFWIVKHGVKYTGMPAWAARERADEIWAVVAFLLRLPDLTPQEYRTLTQPDLPESDTPGPVADANRADLDSLHDPARETLAFCTTCHGWDGRGVPGGFIPRLDILSPIYVAATLQAYAAGARHSGIMEPAAAGLGKRAIAALTEHYARGAQTPARIDDTEPLDAELVDAGRQIAHNGVRAEGVPSCASCHGPAHAHRDDYPSLPGQYAPYLKNQLEAWRNEARGGTPYARIMDELAHRLTPAQIDAVAAYYASLPPQ